MAQNKCQEQQLVTSQLPNFIVASTILFILMEETTESLTGGKLSSFVLVQVIDFLI